MTENNDEKSKLELLEEQSEKGGLTALRELEHQEKQDQARMTLAYWVLGGIGVVLILSIICNSLSKFNLIDSSLSPTLLEIWKTGLLPIITLILGYYFSKK